MPRLLLLNLNANILGIYSITYSYNDENQNASSLLAACFVIVGFICSCSMNSVQSLSREKNRKKKKKQEDDVFICSSTYIELCSIDFDIILRWDGVLNMLYAFSMLFGIKNVHILLYVI